MYLWQICLCGLVTAMTIGISVRFDAEKFGWRGQGNRTNLRLLKEADLFLWILLILEGLITIVSVILFFISVPLYFIYEI